MRLKKIEIVGFKSFADREVLQVDDHISGVVGPNGCGKSNIVDAVRWCMGEQSAKHLRGGGMSDVIFAGCATRGPAGMAEVTITFETGPDVPETYRDFTEIAVTRRLFADGTSEYLINKVQCRLRDITELLMGTGSGTKGYAIIEQGQIGRIVSSKPEARRHIIDEAAGITRFKAQKVAAQRKIEATRQNLLRVKDVMGELEGRIGNLRRQAQKAERYKRYRKELRDLDLWTTSHSYLELQCLGRVLAERRTDLARQAEDLRNELAARDADLEARRLELSEVEDELAGRGQKTWGLDNRIQLLEKDAEHREKEKGELEARLAQARAEAEVVGRRVHEIEDELRQVCGEQGRLEGGEGADGEQVVGRVEASHVRVCQRLREEQAELERTQASKAELETELASAEATLQGRVEASAQLRARSDSLRREIEALAAEHEADARALETATVAARRADAEVEQLKARRADLDLQRAKLRDSVSAAEVELDTKRGEVLRCRSRIQSLEEIQSRYRSCTSGVQVVMEHREELVARAEAGAGGAAAGEPSRSVIHGIMADHIHAPEHLEAAVSAVLGERLQGVVVEAPASGVAGVELLKNLQEGRTTFLPRHCRTPGTARPTREGEGGAAIGWSRDSGRAGDPIEVVDLSETTSGERAGDVPGVLGRLSELVEVDSRFRALAGLLLGDAVVVEELSRALELWQQGKLGRSTLVTLDGDRVEPSGVVVGGSRDALDSALLRQRREIDELKQLFAELESSLEDARRRHLGLAERRAAVENEREQLESRVLEAEKERLERTGQVERLEQAIARTSQRERTLARERDEIDSDGESLAEDIARLTRRIEDGRERLPRLAESITTLEARQVELRAERDGLALSLTEAKVALARFQQQADALSATRTRLEREIASETERVARLEKSVQDGKDRIAELSIRGEEATREHEDLVQQSRVAKDEESKSRAQRDALRIQVDEIDVNLHELRSRLETERESLTEVEMGLQENELERQHLRREIRSRLDVDLLATLVDYHDRHMAGEKEHARHEDLKRIMQRMGEVNLTAIEEYEEVSQRYEFLSHQRADLESAIERLQEAISRIDKTTRKRFRDTFHQVNEAFQRVFPRLFAGGRAELVMSDPHDVLDTGVDIVAQPPGKQLRSIDLLSGGEKALTAVSLVFAIFLLKPSPFCLLDEVDAPLDDANVGRFCNLVQELADSTQFVIITHNKLTMEIANLLYGVTMEQRGVSKLVSVNMTRAVELAYT